MFKFVLSKILILDKRLGISSSNSLNSFTNGGNTRIKIEKTIKDITVNTTYSDIKVPISFIRSEEEGAQEMREAKLYITPDLIGDNQPSLEDEITLNFAGSDRVVQIVDIDTKKGGQTYLFILLVCENPNTTMKTFPIKKKTHKSKYPDFFNVYVVCIVEGIVL